MNRYLVSVFFCVTKMGSEVAALTLGEAFKHVKARGKENKLYSLAHSLNHSLKERQLVTSWKWELSHSGPPCSTMDDRDSEVFRAYVSLKLCLGQDSAINELTRSTLLTLPKSLPSFLCVYRHLYVCVFMFMQIQTDRQTDRCICTHMPVEARDKLSYHSSGTSYLVLLEQNLEFTGKQTWQPMNSRELLYPSPPQCWDSKYMVP